MLRIFNSVCPINDTSTTHCYSDLKFPSPPLSLRGTITFIHLFIAAIHLPRDVNSLIHFCSVYALPPATTDTNWQLGPIYAGLQAIFLPPSSAPPMSLHLAQSQLAASLHCLVIGWELSGGDRLWWWCIYLLSADRRLFPCPDWLGLIAAASVTLFNPVRLEGEFAYSLDETSMEMRGRPFLILADIGGLAKE